MLEISWFKEKNKENEIFQKQSAMLEEVAQALVWHPPKIEVSFTDTSEHYGLLPRLDKLISCCLLALL